VPGRRVRLGVALILLVSLVAYLKVDKTVDLMVDGAVSTVSTLSGTVADLLASEDVSVGLHDRVRPPLAATVTDGMRVQVDHAKEIQLLLNGTTRTIYVIGQTVHDVLEQINVRAGADAYLRPSRDARISDGSVIEYRAAVSITLKVDGRSTDTITNAVDVGYLLDSLGVVLGKDDEVRPALRSPLRNGDEVRVIRVRYREVTANRSVPFGTKTRYSDRLIRGQREVQRAGRPGLVRVDYRVRKEDGKETDRTVLRRKQVRAPVSQVVVVGTRNPDTQTGTSSWYYRDGMVAAHKTLPKGTRVRVTNLANGKQVTVVIDDRGPFVNGWIIDLSDDAFAKLAPLGTGTIRVRLEW
jgi:uncharacterized protein YabE (DUF348 family)